MYPLCAAQIKAARAMLDWSQEHLAQITGLSVTTIRNLETGHISPRHTTTNLIRNAVENAGLEFIDPEGIRRRMDEVRILRGPDSCITFFDDLAQTAREKGGEIIVIAKSLAMLVQACGGANEHLEKLAGMVPVKCLVPEFEVNVAKLPVLQFRITSKDTIGPISYFVYGDCYAIAQQESSSDFRFIIFKSLRLAQAYRQHFLTLWENAHTFPAVSASR